MKRIYLSLTLLLFLAVYVENIQANTSSLIFTAKCNGEGISDDGVNWVITSDGTEKNFDANRGICYSPKNSGTLQYINLLSTNRLQWRVTQVVVNASDKAGNAFASVTVGNTKFTYESNNVRNNDNGADYTFTGNGTGNVLVQIDRSTRASKESLYVKSVTVTYTTNWTEVRTGLEVDRNYTICLEKNITDVRGATFWSIHNYNSGDNSVYLEEETAPLGAGKPYIYQATADKLEVVYGDETAVAPVENGALRGTFSYMDASALGTVEGSIYMMYNNALHPIGENNHLDAHRAYLLYDALVPGEPTPAPGRQVRRMPMQDNTATNLSLSNTSEVPTKTLINGHLFILRGEHIYDLSGCRVK